MFEFRKEHMDNLVNREHIKSVTDGDKDFIKELVKLYLDDNKSRIATIEKIIRDKNYDALLMEAHTLKGASSNLGAEKVADLASEMEKDAKTGNFENMEGLFSQLKSAFELTVSELENLANS